MYIAMENLGGVSDCPARVFSEPMQLKKAINLLKTYLSLIAVLHSPLPMPYPLH